MFRLEKYSLLISLACAMGCAGTTKTTDTTTADVDTAGVQETETTDETKQEPPKRSVHAQTLIINGYKFFKRKPCWS